MTFKENLDLMLIDLSSHKRNKEYLLNTYIEERLNKSLIMYYKEIESKLSDLSFYDSSKILKGLGDNNGFNR